MASTRASSRKSSRVKPRTEEQGATESSSDVAHHLVLEGIAGDWQDCLWAVPRSNTCAWVGRTKATAIWIKEGTVSEKHARFTWDGSAMQWSVEDMGSSNGSKLNGIELVEGKPCRLHAGDVLEFGEYIQVKVHIRPPVPKGITLRQLLEMEAELNIDYLKEKVKTREIQMREDMEKLQRDKK